MKFCLLLMLLLGFSSTSWSQTLPPAPNCASGTFAFENTPVFTNSGYSSSAFHLIDGATTHYILDLPSSMECPVLVIDAIDVISWDGYTNRTSVQPDEQWRLVFLRNGSVVHTTPYTEDIQDGVLSAFWSGSLGTPSIPGGADQVVIAHIGDATYGDNVNTGSNSVHPTGICISFSCAAPEPPATCGTCSGSNQFFIDGNITVSSSGAVSGNYPLIEAVAGSSAAEILTYTIDLPANMNCSSLTIDNISAVSWDGYNSRASTGSQPNEQWRLVFLKNGVVVHTTPYTGDLATGLQTAEWSGSLGSATLTGGVDQVVIAHYEDGTFGTGDSLSANSVYASCICISYSCCPSPNCIDLGVNKN
ncbi:hypothetical protein N8482_02780 [Chitinophagales bacterium]|nr:hypothetical protein [Chitinophagales bacterium]